jgi:hypothetical protein
MKVLRILLILAMSIIAFGSYQSASAAFSYTSAYQVFNLESSEAAITITLYDQLGVAKTPINDTIPGNDTKTYWALNQVTGSFNGSVVISSTTKVASISNIHGGVGTNQFYANGSYIGWTSGSSPIYIPLLMKNNGGYGTWFNVQNTSTTADATVNVAYSDGTTAGPTTVYKGSSHTYNQSSETHSSAVFAATITSSQPVAVTVVEENPSIIFAYNGFLNYSNFPVIPLVNSNNSGYTTSINIMNNGTSDSTVTVSYTPKTGAGNGSACQETQTITAGQVKVFALTAFYNGSFSNCTGGAKFVGSAQVTGNVGSGGSGAQPLTAIVNQHKIGTNGSAYDAFDPATATNRVIFPLIMDRNSNWWTSINVQNVGTTSTSVTCTFNNNPSTFQIGPQTLAAGEVLNDLEWGKFTPATKYVGSATCTASGGSENKIVGIVNEAQNGGAGDVFMTYEGINVVYP